jgi:hypothetical protein
MRASLRKRKTEMWLWSPMVDSLLLVIALEIAIFRFVPCVNDSDTILTVIVSALGIGTGVILFTFIAGFAYD